MEVQDGAGGIHYIRNSGVLEHRDPQSWKWDLILATLKWPPEALRKLEDSSCKIFLKKVTDFYLPSTNMFSRLELDSSRTRFHGRVGCCLLDFLLSCLPTVERQDCHTQHSRQTNTRSRTTTRNTPHYCTYRITKPQSTDAQSIERVESPTKCFSERE